VLSTTLRGDGVPPDWYKLSFAGDMLEAKVSTGTPLFLNSTECGVVVPQDKLKARQGSPNKNEVTLIPSCCVFCINYSFVDMPTCSGAICSRQLVIAVSSRRTDSVNTEGCAKRPQYTVFTGNRENPYRKLPSIFLRFA
jgi:hypothetical protein